MRKTKKLVLGVVVVLAVCGAVAFVWFRNTENGVTFKTEKITRGDIESTVTATGTVNAVTMVLVGTQVSGTIKEIFVDFNSPVAKGQLIAQIDPATFEAQVAQARAALLSARANLKKNEATLVDSKRTMGRNRELFSKNLIARSDLDTAETGYEVAAAQVNAAKAQIGQAEATLSVAETNLRYTRIVSPVNGVVVSRAVDVGQTVAASFQTPTLFTIAQDLTKMQIDTNVDEADIGNIEVGQGAEFTVDAYPDRTFQGRVWQVRIAPISVQNVVTYDVVIKVGNRDLKLKPGMTANVSIIVAEKKDVLRVPNAALRFRPPETGPPAKAARKGSGVWIVANGKAERLGISTGISDGSFTEAVAGGLREGQAVIVESSAKTGKGSLPARSRFF